MPLTSMKRTESEQRGDTLLTGEPVDASKEDYHYGLRITLEEPELQKLNLDEPKVGEKLKMQVVGKLVSYSNDEHGRSATILLTDLGFSDKSDEDNKRSDTLYSKDD